MILNNVCLLWGGVHYCVQLLSWGEFFFSNIPFTFPLLKCFFALLFFFTWSLEILKFPFTWNYNLIHNSMFFLRGPLLCPAASWVLFSNNPFSWSFAINIPYTFSFAKVFFLLINYFLSFFHLKFSEMPNFPKYIMPH